MLPLLVWGALAPARADLALRSDYELLSRAGFAAHPIPVPPEGIRWTVDTATWTLESGQIWVHAPVSRAAVPGIVFEGRGRFEMSVPDRYELRQLRRFAGEPSLEVLRGDFNELVLHTSGMDELSVLAGGAEGYAVHPSAGRRLRHAYETQGYDIAARLVATQGLPGGHYLRADMKTEGYDWLTYIYDSNRREEIELRKFQPAGSFLESWLSLDNAVGRDPEGRPSTQAELPAHVEHADISVKLERRAKVSGWMVGETEVEMTVTPLRNGVAVLPFYLRPDADALRVTDASGAPMLLLRDSSEDRKLVSGRSFDQFFVVVLPRELAKGESVTLRFKYLLDYAGYAMGRRWYPSLENGEFGLLDKHTAKLTITTRKEYEIRAMGDRETDTVDGPMRTSVWSVQRPARMTTFCYARRSMEYPMRIEGMPEVISFGEEAGNDTEDAFHDIAADVVNSMNFFQNLFESPLETERLYATLIDGFHGQAFDGFLHLSSLTALGDHPGATELFRAHEVAHEWWGHKITWAGYRDQWLSEAFAEYSAMMFVQASMEKGPALFDEILESYTSELTGSLKNAFSKFSRPTLALVNRAEAGRIGPIAHGWRANTHRAPTAYWSMTYNKGAYVLHMLRMILRQITGSDETFIAVLRDFAATFQSKPASTAGFQAVLARHAPAEWDWFFDQWVYGTDIPTYEWSAEIPRAANAEGKYVVELTVRQSGVRSGFRMPVPVRLELKGDRVGQVMIMIDRPEKTFQIPVPERPRKVELNPGHAVLARTKKR